MIDARGDCTGPTRIRRNQTRTAFEERERRRRHDKHASSSSPRACTRGDVLYVRRDAADIQHIIVIPAFRYDPHLTVSRITQNHLNVIALWANRWKIQINETKSTRVIFPLRDLDCPSVMFNNKIISPAKEVKYLGSTFDERLTWSAHLK